MDGNNNLIGRRQALVTIVGGLVGGFAAAVGCSIPGTRNDRYVGSMHSSIVNVTSDGKVVPTQDPENCAALTLDDLAGVAQKFITLEKSMPEKSEKQAYDFATQQKSKYAATLQQALNNAEGHLYVQLLGQREPPAGIERGMWTTRSTISIKDLASALNTVVWTSNPPISADLNVTPTEVARLVAGASSRYHVPAEMSRSDAIARGYVPFSGRMPTVNKLAGTDGLQDVDFAGEPTGIVYSILDLNGMTGNKPGQTGKFIGSVRVEDPAYGKLVVLELYGRSTASRLPGSR